MKKYLLFYIFSVDANETEYCPYCPPGMLCDPSTNTCIKGSYCCQHRTWFHLILFSVPFIAVEKFVNMYVLYISHVHISQIIYKTLFIQSTKFLLLSCMITKNDLFEIFVIFFHTSFLSRRMFLSRLMIRIFFYT